MIKRKASSSSDFKTEHVFCGSNSETNNYKIFPVRRLEPCGMIIDCPPLPPPAAKGCTICILSKQINPLILGNDFESMATERMFTREIQWTEILGDEKWARKKRGSRRMQRMMVDEDSAHLHTFVITIVCFLRVQIYKTDLKETKRKRRKIRVTVWRGGEGRLYRESWARVEYKVSQMSYVRVLCW